MKISIPYTLTLTVYVECTPPVVRYLIEIQVTARATGATAHTRVTERPQTARYALIQYTTRKCTSTLGPGAWALGVVVGTVY